MARRVSWTNNSSGHSGTYVYRAATLDPQNLPAPVATVDPVAQGATAEWVDSADVYECYAVQDFDGQGAGTLSAEVCATEPAPDYSTAQVGDEIGGGIYAGTITYADAREFHIIAAKQAGESTPATWSDTTVVTGIEDLDDGKQNTDDAIAFGGSFPAFEHCVNYSGGGFGDWYLPAFYELRMLNDNLAAIGHPEFSTNLSDYRWESREWGSTQARARRFSDGGSTTAVKTSTFKARPIRRVPV